MSVAEIDGDLLSKNLSAFAQYMPEIYAQLSRHTPQSELVTREDGCKDIEFHGQALYGGNGAEMARAMVDTYRGTVRDRMLLSPMRSANIDPTTSQFLTSMLKAGVDDDFSFLERPNTDDAYHLVVFGLGLGYHLVEFIELTKPRSICIVEPTFDFIYHSLAVIDWQPILEMRRGWAASVSILTGSTVEEMSFRARQHCRMANPTAVDGALVVQSYPNEVMAAAKNRLFSQAGLINMGLGFFHDEMEMTRASYFNLVSNDGFRVLLRSEAPVMVPAFVVGSGPSIDEDIDFIRENQDKSVIFACGSALGVLLSNGIQPDFVLILENGEEPRFMLENMARKFDVSGITLIASNTVSPQIAPLFNERIYFMRQALSSYGMFSPGFQHSLEESGPTVTNTGLSAAIGLGFREIYLFGVDLGSRSPEKHHSKHSPYLMAGRQSNYADGNELKFNGEFGTRALGNFGGIVFTESIFSWSRDALENLISRTRNGTCVYNCSDGILIRGARPQVSSAIHLSSTSAQKKQSLAKVISNCPKAETFDFASVWANGDWRNRLRAYADRLIAEAEAAPDRVTDFLHAMSPLIIPDHFRVPYFEEFFIRGTTFIALIGLDYYVRRAHPSERRGVFLNAAYREWIAMLDRMVDQGHWFLDHIDEFRTANDLEQALREYEP
jgi:hypothetical protein